jgi:hypothetical protein
MRAFSPSAVLLSCLALAGCFSSVKPEPEKSTTARPVVSHGYALLYERASELKHLDKILAVKRESDEVKKVTDDVATWASKLSEELEALSSRYPSIRLDDNGLPDVENRTIEMLNRDHVKRILPFVGESGPAYERLLLFDEWDRVEHEYHLANSLAEFETNNERKAFLLRVARRYQELYDEVGALLRKRYFCMSHTDSRYRARGAGCRACSRRLGGLRP